MYLTCIEMYLTCTDKNMSFGITILFLDLERTCLLQKTSVKINLVTYKTNSILNVIT